MYISITGLRLLKPWKIFSFYWYAVPAFRQAQNAPGNVFAAVKKINGVRHTLTAWENKKSMQAFLYNGAHLKAIRAFPKIANGKTLGYEAEEIPSWDEVHKIWHKRGRDYTKTIPKKP